MTPKTHTTPLGTIHYWTNTLQPSRKTLVMLPGLTADHRLFDKQVAAFESQFNLLVWDAPGHALSRPFSLTFTLADKARWLKAILDSEGIAAPILVGQSMGGYVSQAFMQLFPDVAQAFVSIDSSTLQRRYYTRAELWMLHHVEPIYRCYPWQLLVRHGAIGCSTTPYGRTLMATMMHDYDPHPRYYSQLVGHGYRMLAQAVETDLPYSPHCPTLLLCGDHDIAGSTRCYNKRWSQEAKLPLQWIANAGHNSNSDNPEQVNRLITNFINQLD